MLCNAFIPSIGGGVPCRPQQSTQSRWKFLTAALLLISGCFNSPASRIEEVLNTARQAGTGASSVAEIVTRMRAIKTSGCPNDFRSAHLAHIHAWEELAAIELKYAAFERQSTSGAAFVEAFIRGALGDPLGKANEVFAGQEQLQRHYEVASQSVVASWNRLEEIAVLHGAILPDAKR